MFQERDFKLNEKSELSSGVFFSSSLNSEITKAWLLIIMKIKQISLQNKYGITTPKKIIFKLKLNKMNWIKNKTEWEKKLKTFTSN